MFDVGLGTLVTYNPTALTPDATLAAVVRLFARDGIRHLPVVNADRRVIGMVSSLDVQRARSSTERNAAGGNAASTSAGAGCELLVRDLMKSPVLTVDQNDNPLSVLNLLLTNRIHSVPVVANQRLIGIVTSTDFLRELSYGEDPLFREPISRHMQVQCAQVELSAPLDAAAKTIKDLDVEYLAVMSGGTPVGILARRDLDTTDAVPGEVLPSLTTVAQNCQSDAPSVSPADRLGDAVRLMLDRRASAVLVVDRGRRLRGLLSQEIVLHAISASLDQVATQAR